MAAVFAHGLGFAYSDRVPVLDQVQFRLVQGWYGLVGANGSGKTTLARLILGELKPTTGVLRLEPARAHVHLCEQAIETATLTLHRFARASDGESCRWRGLLKLDPEMLDRWEVLSPGEQKRWQLGAALSASPDVLIVDEPTNHLDAEARNLVVEALGRFAGIGILVSHDREVLQALTSRTLRIQAGRVESYPDAYVGARALWQAAEKQQAHARELAIEQRNALERRVHDVRRSKEAASHNRSAKARMKNRHDHDASSIMADGRAANGEARLSRSLAVVSAKLERAGAAIPEFVVDKMLGRSLFVGYQPAAASRFFGLEGECVQVGGKTLINDVRVAFGRHSRVHLLGRNGAGKSSLIAALWEKAGTIRERCLWLPQSLTTERVCALFRAARSLPPSERGRLLQILAALGTDPERALASESPSPGEARKLCLAFGMATHAVALILDEPTNHLDLQTIERLEVALAAFPGALLLVSHDRSFARACTTETWEIRGERLVVT